MHLEELVDVLHARSRSRRDTPLPLGIEDLRQSPFLGRHRRYDCALTLDVLVETALVDLGLEKNIIQKTGSWYSFGDERIGQGRDAVIDFLKSNEDIAQKIEARLREELNLPHLKKREDKQDRTAKKE